MRRAVPVMMTRIAAASTCTRAYVSCMQSCTYMVIYDSLIALRVDLLKSALLCKSEIHDVHVLHVQQVDFRNELLATSLIRFWISGFHFSLCVLFLQFTFVLGQELQVRELSLKMLDLFTIFTKGGMVLWFFRGTTSMLTQPVNSLIENVLIMQRSRTVDDSLTFKYKLDSELDIVFLLAHQKILELGYADRLLESVHDAFQMKFSSVFGGSEEPERHDFSGFDVVFEEKLQAAEMWQRQQTRPMRPFIKQKDKLTKATSASTTPAKKDPEPAPAPVVQPAAPSSVTRSPGQMAPRGYRKLSSPKAATAKKTKKTKADRTWQNSKLSRDDQKALDYSADVQSPDDAAVALPIGGGHSMAGALRDIDDSIDIKTNGGSSSSGVLGFFRGLVSNKVITQDSLAPVLEKMKEHLVGKNVAQEIAQSLCDSVAEKLAGRTMGTFGSVSSTVRETLEESLMQILSAGGSHDTLRDVLEAKRQRRPYVITFCGVNGVGKSTNLAKIAFWLLQNGHRILVAGCDTFRAGAVEQLRVHVQRLHSQHPPTQELPNIQLFERGYGKDPAGIAADAIGYAKERQFDVVLVDTAGRMQDDEPLMRALAKLIKVNAPDLVLFVGEALVGNEAVDQLSKFNTALVDHGDGRLQIIDGVLLTKFDTVDDKMGAAVSMAYTSRKPIMFVGTGQTYHDLKSLNATSVVKALLR